MNGIKVFPLVITALLLTASAAGAVTVVNKDSKQHSIGIDWGNKEEVKEVPAGKSVKFDCPEGCGVTGPWGYSWMAKSGDTLTTDGKELIPDSG